MPRKATSELVEVDQGDMQSRRSRPGSRVGILAGASLQDWLQRVYTSRNDSTTDVLLIAFARGQVLGVLNRKDVLLPPDMVAFLRLEHAQALSNLRDLNRHIQRSKVLTSNTSVCSSRPPRMQSNPPLSRSAQCQGGRLLWLQERYRTSQ